MALLRIGLLRPDTSLQWRAPLDVLTEPAHFVGAMVLRVFPAGGKTTSRPVGTYERSASGRRVHARPHRPQPAQLKPALLTLSGIQMGFQVECREGCQVRFRVGFHVVVDPADVDGCWLLLGCGSRPRGCGWLLECGSRQLVGTPSCGKPQAWGDSTFGFSRPGKLRGVQSVRAVVTPAVQKEDGRPMHTHSVRKAG